MEGMGFEGWIIRGLNDHVYTIYAAGPALQQKLGIVKMLKTIYCNEGLPGLYRGIVPNFLKVIPAVSIGYVAYEQFKTMLHVRK